MPTYDYLCQACAHKFEEFQSMTAKPLRKCPACGKLKLKRLIGTGAGIIFKGSGFYETDYRSQSYKNAAKADKDSSSSSTAASASSASSSTNATPATATPPAKDPKPSSSSAGKTEGKKKPSAA
ncbi:MAG: zinc ribbon domain-containing protein [Phycisphaeraceae bacterium]|nr:zinc ribbon domain-containing protein [Phycisphaeraceae bacterium]